MYTYSVHGATGTQVYESNEQAELVAQMNYNKLKSEITFVLWAVTCSFTIIGSMVFLYTWS